MIFELVRKLTDPDPVTGPTVFGLVIEVIILTMLTDAATDDKIKCAGGDY